MTIVNSLGGEISILWLLILVWLALVTLAVGLIIFRYRKLTKGGQGKDLAQIIERLISNQDKERKITELNQRAIGDLENSIKSHVQKMAMVKYNPFNQTGGNQSFSLVLLDGKNNGIVISSFHSREGTRLYAKNISGGKADDSFSKEEKAALKEAVGK